MEFFPLKILKKKIKWSILVVEQSVITLSQVYMKNRFASASKDYFDVLRIRGTFLSINFSSRNLFFVMEHKR